MRVYLPSLAVSMIVLGTAAPALAAGKIYSPYVEKGEAEIEYFGSRSFDGDSSKDNAQKHQFAFGYGVTERWATEFSASFEKEPGDSMTFDAWEWENIFQLTEQGEYWLDVGALVAYEWTPQDHRADKVEAKLLLAKDFGKISNVMNLKLEKEVGSDPKDDLETGLALSTRYRYRPEFEPGLELHSDFGEWDHHGSFNDQEHYLGPVAYGAFSIIPEKGQAIEYRVGYLFGVSDAAEAGNAILELEYEFRF